MGKHIAIIGSGFGGLGAAIRLAARGHRVEIFEKLDKPGGRAYTVEMNGFKFDTGPTAISAPFMFDDIWKEAGKQVKDYFELLPVSPFYRVFDWERKHFDVVADEAATLAEIERWNPADKEGYKRYIHSIEPIFQKGFVELSDKPFLKVTDMFQIAPDFIKLGLYKSVYSYISDYIKDDFLRQVFTFHTLLVGGNPFDTTSIYTLIHYIENEWGIWFARVGTGAIISAMVRLFEELGGVIHYNREVCRIETEGRKVTGLRLGDGLLLPFDFVVSNADPAWTYRYLIPAQARRTFTDRRLDGMQYTMSLFVLYFGTKRRYDQTGLAHHNIFLSRRYKGLLDDIFNRKVLTDDYSLYLHMPTITDPSVAPEGCENFYVLSPVPHLDAKVDWSKQAPLYRNMIVNFLEENYLPELQENIVAEHFVDPRYYQDTLNSYKGAGFSFQPVLTQSAWFRPHNQSEDFDNLFFVGAGTHPGAGVPGVLSSSIIAADLISAAV
jgi:phytoene desaturase